MLRNGALVIGDRLAEAFRRGRKLLIFGNGGSAADAQHLAAELVNRYRLDRPPLPAIALTTDTSTLTSIANDVDYREIFARQVHALAAPGDIVLAISTSGSSPNIIQGLRAARERKTWSAALLGSDGGDAAGLADLDLIVASNETARIQEAHLLVEHMICEVIEFRLFRAPLADVASA
ncbi:MAG: SIS domain-containing protein [Candidatus Dadabacteria bacterium]|nr:MAG: SIS domain-containing protein [Candidatus Dadabacteria bacterium]